MVDSLCTLGPITDASLVPSAYHVSKTANTGSGGGFGLGGGAGGSRRGRNRGGRGGRGQSRTGSRAATGTALTGGGGGGGIRTSLVCAAGYGQQGSLAVFSAGLRTEVNITSTGLGIDRGASLLRTGIVWSISEDKGRESNE